MIAMEAVRREPLSRQIPVIVENVVVVVRESAASSRYNPRKTGIIGDYPCTLVAV